MKLLLLICIAFMSQLSFSQETATVDGPSEEELAKASQNPLAKMISVPFQNNTTYGVGTEEKAQNTLNIQPVYPIGLENINLIN